MDSPQIVCLGGFPQEPMLDYVLGLARGRRVLYVPTAANDDPSWTVEWWERLPALRRGGAAAAGVPGARARRIPTGARARRRGRRALRGHGAARDPDDADRRGWLRARDGRRAPARRAASLAAPARAKLREPRDRAK